jgi:hypothetical protein
LANVIKQRYVWFHSVGFSIPRQTTVHIRKEKKFDEIVETRVFGRFSGSMEGISRQRNLSPVQLLGMGTVHVNFRLMVTISIQNHFYSRLIGGRGGNIRTHSTWRSLFRCSMTPEEKDKDQILIDYVKSDALAYIYCLLLVLVITV